MNESWILRDFRHIEEEIWLEMLEARNRMAHTYKAEEALSVYSRLASFNRALRGLLTQLEAVE